MFNPAPWDHPNVQELAVTGNLSADNSVISEPITAKSPFSSSQMCPGHFITAPTSEELCKSQQQLSAMLPLSDRMVCRPRSRYLHSHNRGIPVPKEPTTIGQHLRKRRLQLRIHQSEAARMLKVSTVTLSRWECDKVYPTWAQRQRNH